MNIVDLIETCGFVALEKNSNLHQVDYLNIENHDVTLTFMPQLGYTASFLAEHICNDDDWEAELYAELGETYLDTHSDVENYIKLFVTPPLFGGIKGNADYSSEFTTVGRCTLWLLDGKYILLEADRAQFRDALTIDISMGLTALVGNRFIRLGAKS